MYHRVAKQLLLSSLGKGESVGNCNNPRVAKLMNKIPAGGEQKFPLSDVASTCLLKPISNFAPP
jgi:hypothetical protein